MRDKSVIFAVKDDKMTLTDTENSFEKGATDETVEGIVVYEGIETSKMRREQDTPPPSDIQGRYPQK